MSDQPSIQEGFLRCCACKEVKPVASFYVIKSKRGYKSDCIPCSIARAVEWKRANREKARSIERRYRKRATGKATKGRCNANWNEANAEQRAESNRRANRLYRKRKALSTPGHEATMVIGDRTISVTLVGEIYRTDPGRILSGDFVRNDTREVMFGVSIETVDVYLNGWIKRRKNFTK